MTTNYGVIPFLRRSDSPFAPLFSVMTEVPVVCVAQQISEISEDQELWPLMAVYNNKNYFSLVWELIQPKCQQHMLMIAAKTLTDNVKCQNWRMDAQVSLYGTDINYEIATIVLPQHPDFMVINNIHLISADWLSLTTINDPALWGMRTRALQESFQRPISVSFGTKKQKAI